MMMITPLKFLRTINPFTITCFTIIIITALFLTGNALIDMIELKTYDLRLLSRGRIEPSPTVALALVDEKSLDTEGRWPWPRAKLATLVDLLSDDGARVIGFDIGFLEPDGNTQLGFINRLEHQVEVLDINSAPLSAFIDENRKNADNDRVLADAIRNSSATSVLGYFFHMNVADLEYQIVPEEIERQIERISASKYPLVMMKGGRKEGDFIQAYAPESSLDILVAATDAAGFYSIKGDMDGVIRWMPLIIQCGEDVFPPLSVASAWHYLGRPQLVVEVAAHGVEGIQMGERFIPTDETGHLLINYLGPPKTFPHFSIHDILSGFVPKGTFKDKVVVVGATAMGTHDLRNTPLHPLFPGVEIHATLIENILSENFMVKPKWAHIYDLFAIFLVAVVTGVALPRVGALNGLLVTAVLFTLYIFSAHWIFVHFKLWLNMVYPLIALILNYTVLRVHGYITKDREQKKIQSTFKQYVAPMVIEEMMQDPDKLTLGGEEKELTVLFNDIAGFTSLSERQTPTEMVDILGRYFEEMTKIVFDYRGTLESYMGDEFMAIFGAPIEREDHAEKACIAALAIRDRLGELQREWARTGHPVLNARTGINSGQMLVGNLGCRYRFVYGALGDNVNLSSRLEGLNKVYNTDILIGENTAQMVDGSFRLREIDMVRAKGKEAPVKIYELLAQADTPLSPELKKADEIYAAGLAAYRQQAWREAMKQFNRAMFIRPDDGAAKTMALRCRAYMDSPPDKDWDGVFEQINK